MWQLQLTGNTFLAAISTKLWRFPEQNCLFSFAVMLSVAFHPRNCFYHFSHQIWLHFCNLPTANINPHYYKLLYDHIFRPVKCSNRSQWKYSFQWLEVFLDSGPGSLKLQLYSPPDSRFKPAFQTYNTAHHQPMANFVEPWKRKTSSELGRASRRIF